MISGSYVLITIILITIIPEIIDSLNPPGGKRDLPTLIVCSVPTVMTYAVLGYALCGG